MDGELFLAKASVIGGKKKHKAKKLRRESSESPPPSALNVEVADVCRTNCLG